MVQVVVELVISKNCSSDLFEFKVFTGKLASLNRSNKGSERLLFENVLWFKIKVIKH